MKPWGEIAAMHGVKIVEQGDDGGAFLVGGLLRVIASDGLGWDHVSVSKEHTVPTWSEMETVKRIFFRENETALQFHVPPSDHINRHKNCLHLWRPQHAAIPRPPKELV